MDNEKFLVIKDTREKTGWEYSEDKLCRGYIRETVKYGDYTVKGLEHLLMIERKKTPAEIAQNITEKRFAKQMEACKNFKYKFMILEFSLADVIDFPNENSGLNYHLRGKLRVSGNFMLSYLTDISLNQGIHMIYAGNAEKAERIAYEIMRKVFVACKDQML